MSISFNLFVIVGGTLCGICTVLIPYFLMFNKKTKNSSFHDDSIKNTTFVFSGNLRQTSLMEAIQFLELGRREGVLHIYCGRRKGYITFKQGRMVDAFYRNATGKDAILEMFEIDEGDFYFEPKEVNQPVLIKESILDLTFLYDEKKRNLK